MKIKTDFLLLGLCLGLSYSSFAMEERTREDKQQLTQEVITAFMSELDQHIKKTVHEETDIKVADWHDNRTQVPVQEYVALLSHSLMSRIDQVAGAVTRMEQNITTKLTSFEGRVAKLEGQMASASSSTGQGSVSVESQPKIYPQVYCRRISKVQWQASLNN